MVDPQLVKSVVTGSISTFNIIVGLTVRDLWLKGEKAKAIAAVILAGGGSAAAIYLVNKLLKS